MRFEVQRLNPTCAPSTLKGANNAFSSEGGKLGLGEMLGQEQKAVGSASGVCLSLGLEPDSSFTVTKGGRRKLRVVNLLRQRELDPRGWSSAPLYEDFTTPCPSTAIADWVESDFFSHCSAAYCHLGPPPRSTIALAFSHDGSLLASTQYAHSGMRRLEGHMIPLPSYASWGKRNETPQWYQGSNISASAWMRGL